MANGVLCKCGHQETDHLIGVSALCNGDEKLFKEMYPNLAKCKGYKPVSKEGLEKQKEPFWSERD